MRHRPFRSKRELVGWLNGPAASRLSRYLENVYKSDPGLRRAYPLGDTDGHDRLLWWFIQHHEPPARELLEPAFARLAERSSRGRRWGLNRYALMLYAERPDLRAAFPDLDGYNGLRYLAWIYEKGRCEVSIPPRLLPRPTLRARRSLKRAGAVVHPRDWQLWWSVILHDELPDPELLERAVEGLAERAAPGRKWGLNRYAQMLYAERPDLRDAFPDLDGHNGLRYLAWIHEKGQFEVPIPPRLLPRPTPRARRSLREAGTSLPASTGDDRPRPDLAPSHRLVSLDPGVNLAGLLGASIGIGEAARLLAAGIEAAGVPITRIDCGPLLLGERNGTAGNEAPAVPQPRRAVDLLCVNAPELGIVIRSLSDRLPGRHAVGFWWWEVENALPDSWLPGFLSLDEIWVASEHVRRGIAARSPVTVQTIRLPVTPPAVAELRRDELGLPNGCVFLLMFDYESSTERKNPIGAIEAFKRAFPSPSPAVTLVVKSLNASRHPHTVRALHGAAQGRPDIEFLDEQMPVERKNALIAACDCLVSLHRAEGFGLPLAEAMLLERPVIATGYSGNLEFMTADNSYLVDYERVPVTGTSHLYPVGGTWAEPDVGHAARLMRHVYEHRDEAAAKGRRAAADLRRDHSLEAAGESIAARFDELARRTGLAVAPAGQAISDAVPATSR